jgi:succinate dehydrogenase/fumarate reductase-like Fe-S protein
MLERGRPFILDEFNRIIRIEISSLKSRVTAYNYSKCMEGGSCSVLCPKCHSAMAFVAALRHSNSAMLKTTFLCQACNRTWAYMLSPQIAERYQAEHQSENPPREIVWV